MIIHIENQVRGVPLCNCRRSQRLLTMPIPNWKTLRSQQHFQRTREHNPRLCYNCVSVFAARTPLQATGR
ncbi:hypothetical protein LCGC14_1031570 [marine sediment metagenome]|uniref:Uncharacterized protein n=1 Tax=marine sediment metagenome TaxID=412755 RepID=A0A0F9R0D4_9ZZZZ